MTFMPAALDAGRASATRATGRSQEGRNPSANGLGGSFQQTPDPAQWKGPSPSRHSGMGWTASPHRKP
jgi:hypothetical protein